MDVIVLGIEMSVALFITLFAVGKRGKSMAMFPLMASIIPVYSLLSLGVDGDLTNGATIISSAATPYDWTGVLLIPLIVIMVCLGFAVAKAVGTI